jgi:hypothetical protein
MGPRAESMTHNKTIRVNDCISYGGILKTIILPGPLLLRRCCLNVYIHDERYTKVGYDTYGLNNSMWVRRLMPLTYCYILVEYCMVSALLFSIYRRVITLCPQYCTVVTLFFYYFGCIPFSGHCLSFSSLIGCTVIF